MRLINKTPTIDFMGKRPLALGLSVVLIVASIFFLVTQKLNFGIDFTGGVLVEVSYPQNIDVSEVRQVLGGAGFEQAQVQHFGSPRDVLIRLMPQAGVDGAKLRQEIFVALSGANQQVDVRRVDFVGPQVGD